MAGPQSCRQEHLHRDHAVPCLARGSFHVTLGQSSGVSRTVPWCLKFGAAPSSWHKTVETPSCGPVGVARLSPGALQAVALGLPVTTAATGETLPQCLARPGLRLCPRLFGPPARHQGSVTLCGTNSPEGPGMSGLGYGTEILSRSCGPVCHPPAGSRLKAAGSVVRATEGRGAAVHV